VWYGLGGVLISLKNNFSESFCAEGNSKNVKFESFSAEETELIAQNFGKNALPGEIFCLSGNLGAGKTIFAKGFAKGLGYNGRVTSPTFTIMNEYLGGRLPLYHFDLYRLGGESDMESIGYEDYFFSAGVTLVEWPEAGGEAIPAQAVRIEIRPDATRGENYREILAK